MSEFEFEIKSSNGRRLDVVLTESLRSDEAAKMINNSEFISRSKVEKLIESGCVRINDEIITKPSFRPDDGDNVSLLVPDEHPNAVFADSSVSYEVIYEDSEVLVINKPAGLVVHPGSGCECSTLVHGLVARYGVKLLEIGHPLRPGIVHRLDKETSGLMVVALTQKSYVSLTGQFLPPRTVKRKYLALVGRLPVVFKSRNELNGTIELPISRCSVKRTKMSALQGYGREAVTHWEVKEAYSAGYLLELTLETGRTHQIRAHLEAMRCPIVGDDLYGYHAQKLPMNVERAIKDMNRVGLHAHKLSFLHPADGSYMEFVAKLPDDMDRVLNAMRVSNEC